MHAYILGTRGIPSRHGGFETFAQDLSIYLVSRNHQVTVYCQCDRDTPAYEDMWRGVRRVFLPASDGALGTIQFDWAAIRDASRAKGIVLTLGYNTGIFNYLLRWRKIATVMNMDGIEWKRAKWSPLHRAWLWLNEIAGAHASDHLVADHPEISTHLQRHTPASKITVIPYGAQMVKVDSTHHIAELGLELKNYFLVIARAEPDNSILDIVQAYSARPRKSPLVILGRYSPETSAYHRQILQSAGEGVKFLGPVYDREIVEALRYHAKAYIHGHRVGGTNPSLVESLAAGNAVVAHNNRFTRWVAGQSAEYFDDVEHLTQIFNNVEADSSLLKSMEEGSKARHEESFQMERVLAAYETLLLRAIRRDVKDEVPATFNVSGVSGMGLLDANHWVYRKAPGSGSRQRRAAIRQRLELPIVYHWIEQGVAYSQAGSTSDISSNGVLILGSKLPPVNCELRIETLSLNAGPGDEERGTEFFGRVTRIVRQDVGFGFGVSGTANYEQLAQRVLQHPAVVFPKFSPQATAR